MTNVNMTLRADLEEHLRGCEHCEITLSTTRKTIRFIAGTRFMSFRMSSGAAAEGDSGQVQEVLAAGRRAQDQGSGKLSRPRTARSQKVHAAFDGKEKGSGNQILSPLSFVFSVP